MREDINFNMIPIVKNSMDDLVYNAGSGITSFSSNGYYGFQAHLRNKEKAQSQQHETMEYECENAVQCEPGKNNILRFVNRKRAWEYNEPFNFKKRRQNETVPLTPDPNSSQQLQNELHMRKPTHNMPDIPRCIMSHYV